MSVQRCQWAGDDPLNQEYHDAEWGVPLHDEHKLFELLILEGAQAGLSWITILRKRASYREAFDNFDPAVVARYDERKQAELLANPGIVRNRQKVESAVGNAKAALKLQKEFGSLDAYFWNAIGGKPIQNSWPDMKCIPPRSAESDAISKDLKQRGFRFFGTTICYAHMQATGMVNDHVVDCFRYRQVKRLGK